jgi:peptidoglycan/LPS O-acetylase OafA/YrhL
MKHIREFDGLRGLLALWVFATHVIELGPYPSAATMIHANLAVDIFIILSGFVIFHLLSTGEDYRTFITRRWFRLFPVFAVCFLAALVLFAWLGVNDETAFGMAHTKNLMPYLITHATMLHGAVPDSLLPQTARAILVPAWSISVEWQFYLVAPLLFAFAVRPNWKLGLVMVSLLALRVTHDLARAGSIPGQTALVFDMAAFLPLKLEYFAVGAGSYAIWRWLSERERPLHLPPLSWALLVPVLVLIAKRNPAIAMWLCGMLMLANIHFGNGTRIGRLTSRFLKYEPVQSLGQISYCFYLLHLPALILVRQIVHWNQPALSAPSLQIALIVGGLMVSIAGSWLLHVMVEQPMIAFGKQLTKSWKRPAPASAPVGTARAA